jgi:EmrB/QacA subfamily drug resistance transporter
MPAPTGNANPPSELSHREIVVVILGVGLGLLLAALDGTIVSTALPTIVGELGGLEKLSWVVTAYMLASTATTPLYGKLSDQFGRKQLFQAAILIFLVGSVLCGQARTMTQLVSFRAVQGLGAGGLMALTFVIVADLVPPRRRGRYTGYLTGIFAISSVAGPLAGGFIVDHLSWRWVFYVNLPVGGVALVVTSIVLRLPASRVARRIDVEGAVLLVASVSSLLLATVWGGRQYAWTSPVILGLGGAAVVLGVGFVLWERRAAEPIIPLRLFDESVFRVTGVASFLIGAGMFGGAVFLPLYLQAVQGASPTNSGLLMVPMMGGLLVLSIVGGRTIAATGRYKPRWG